MLLNKNTDEIPPDSVYIGRGSKWGNPFRIGPDGSRSEVIWKYECWLKTQPDLVSAIDELDEKSLVCYCSPKACHGKVLLKVLNMTDSERIRWANNSYQPSNFFDKE